MIAAAIPIPIPTILFGGLISLAAHRWHMRPISAEAEGELRLGLTEARDAGMRRGLLFAAGLITGEAILGILLAIPIVMFKGENPMDIGARVRWLPSVWPGAILLLVVMYWLYRTARK